MTEVGRKARLHSRKVYSSLVLEHLEAGHVFLLSAEDVPSFSPTFKGRMEFSSFFFFFPASAVL